VARKKGRSYNVPGIVARELNEFARAAFRGVRIA
jgi:hypothetical protein